ncbi:MAG: hypothetical protein V7L23_08010 [Nostoc sp.]|uniref:hypothetical protein n=1 Tax=Nostoc sp. TaxID=1180 RepID=UPI002FF31535
MSFHWSLVIGVKRRHQIHVRGGFNGFFLKTNRRVNEESFRNWALDIAIALPTHTAVIN